MSYQHPPTLDEWAVSTPAHKLLRDNLTTNQGVYITPEGCDFDGLMRTNMIMIRQFADQILKQDKARIMKLFSKAVQCPECREAVADTDELFND